MWIAEWITKLPLGNLRLGIEAYFMTDLVFAIMLKVMTIAWVHGAACE